MYLYHRVPQELKGTVLYPLNVLKDLHPATYAKELRKYDDRMALMATRVPTLNCMWNDVLFLSAIHPKDHRESLREAGLPAIDFHIAYEIPFEMLDPNLTTIWLGIRRPEDADEYLAYTEKNVKQCQTVPEWAIAMWQAALANRLRPKLFSGMPHVLYKGSLNVAGLKKTKL